MNTHGGDTMAHGRISPLALLVSAVLMTTAHPGIAATQKTEPVTGHAPVAAPVLSTLTPHVGDTITVTTNFNDVDGDEEDTTATGTSYQWQVEKTAGAGDYEDIAGQTGKTWTAAEADTGKKVRVTVLPRTAPGITEPYEGIIAMSEPAEVIGISEANSALTITTLAADNTITAGEQTGTDAEKATLVLALRDNAGAAVTGQTVTFEITPADPGLALSAVTARADGTYAAVLTGTKAQAYTVATKVGGTALTGTRFTPVVTVVPSVPDATNSIITSDSPKVEGNNITISATLADRYANAITPEAGKLTIVGAEGNGTGFTLSVAANSEQVDGSKVIAGITSNAYPMDIRTAQADVAYNGVNLGTVRSAFAPNLDIGTKTPQCVSGGYYRVRNYPLEAATMTYAGGADYKTSEGVFVTPGVSTTDAITGLVVHAQSASGSIKCGFTDVGGAYDKTRPTGSYTKFNKTGIDYAYAQVRVDNMSKSSANIPYSTATLLKTENQDADALLYDLPLHGIITSSYISYDGLSNPVTVYAGGGGNNKRVDDATIVNKTSGNTLRLYYMVSAHGSVKSATAFATYWRAWMPDATYALAYQDHHIIAGTDLNQGVLVTASTESESSVVYNDGCESFKDTKDSDVCPSVNNVPTSSDGSVFGNLTFYRTNP